ncbi:hypothetical protein CDEST_07645 [Colletotrichum destructivum]|uniref:Uncharacterized protein n=1 Tax=Colletotrichum destructivum TaxID=34406 RepID=A0AAX4II61_9PEZI|nr:hypothetical protein CDEST_07645 [Colletotrichum destructivum]
MALYQQQQQQEECGRGPKHEGDEEVRSVQAPPVQVLAQARQTQGQVRSHFVQFQGVVAGRVPAAAAAAAVALAGAVAVGAAVTAAPVQSATTACWSALQLPLP